MKDGNGFLREANAVVPRISAADGIAKHGAGNSLFIDVRDSGDIATRGHTAGSLRTHRRLFDFPHADNPPSFIACLSTDSDILLLCRAGRPAALVGPAP